MHIQDKRISFSPPQILVFGFSLIVLLGAVLLTLPVFTVTGLRTDFMTALFTATSAVCVTGLVVVDTGTHWSLAGQALIMLLVQVGGIGFITMAMIIFIMMGKKIGLKSRLLVKESLNQLSVEGMVRLVINILLFTLGTELLAALILWARWAGEMGIAKGAWYGLFHSVAAFNNAGFDLFGDFRSLTGYASDPTVNLVITSLIIIGGLGFSVVVDVWNNKGERQRLSLHTRLVLVTTVILLIAGTVLFALMEWGSTLRGLPLSTKLLASCFQSVTVRTAGFNTVDMTGLTTTTLFLFILFMFIGASPGSTGGGVKTTTFSLLLLTCGSVLAGHENIQVFRKRIPFDQTQKALTIFVLAFLWVILATMVLTITERADFLTLLFETVSAFGTVGLTVGFTPKLSEIGRLLIIATMFLGKLGPITVFFALTQKKEYTKMKYPEEKIIVG